jgi:hypothetical protein
VSVAQLAQQVHFAKRSRNIARKPTRGLRAGLPLPPAALRSLLLDADEPKSVLAQRCGDPFGGFLCIVQGQVAR